MEQGQSDLWDRAFCNHCGVAMEIGDIDEALPELRQIVLRSSDLENAFLAAYNVARAYELAKDSRRALFYARIARDRCQRLERQDWLAWSENQTANLLLADSLFEEACSGYERALQLVGDEPTVERAMMLDNLGYCRIVQGRTQEGFGLLYDCLRTLIREGAERFQPKPRLSLCYGYLEVGKLGAALRQGLRALEIASRYDDDDSIKNAHYLVGETYNQLGSTEHARDFFTRLQQRYYPQAQHVPELLLAIDVRSIVNLKA